MGRPQIKVSPIPVSRCRTTDFGRSVAVSRRSGNRGIGEQGHRGPGRRPGSARPAGCASGMLRRGSHRRAVPRRLRQAQRPQLLDRHPQRPVPGGQRPDQRPGLVVDAQLHEIVQHPAGAQHPFCCVPGVDQGRLAPPRAGRQRGIHPGAENTASTAATSAAIRSRCPPTPPGRATSRPPCTVSPLSMPDRRVPASAASRTTMPAEPRGSSVQLAGDACGVEPSGRTAQAWAWARSRIWVASTAAWVREVIPSLASRWDT